MIAAFFDERNDLDLLILTVSAHGYHDDTTGDDKFVIFNDDDNESDQQERGHKEFVNINHVVQKFNQIFNSSKEWNKKRVILFFDCCRKVMHVNKKCIRIPTGIKPVMDIRSTCKGDYALSVAREKDKVSVIKEGGKVCVKKEEVAVDAVFIFCENFNKFGDKADVKMVLELTELGVQTLTNLDKVKDQNGVETGYEVDQ